MPAPRRCADALSWRLPKDTRLVYCDDTAWDAHAIQGSLATARRATHCRSVRQRVAQRPLPQASPRSSARPRPDLGQTSARPSQTSAVSPDRPRQEARRRAAGRRRRAAQPAARLQRRPALQAAAGGGGRNLVEHAAPPHRAHDAAGQQRGARRPQGRAVTRVCRGWRCTHSRIEVPVPSPERAFLPLQLLPKFFFGFLLLNSFWGVTWNTSV